jgi:hypothetical protein
MEVALPDKWIWPGLICRQAHQVKCEPFIGTLLIHAQGRRKGERIQISGGTRLWSQHEPDDTADAVQIPRLGAVRSAETVKSHLYSSLQFEFRYRWAGTADRVTAVSFWRDRLMASGTFGNSSRYLADSKKEAFTLTRARAKFRRTLPRRLRSMP